MRKIMEFHWPKNGKLIIMYCKWQWKHHIFLFFFFCVCVCSNCSSLHYILYFMIVTLLFGNSEFKLMLCRHTPGSPYWAESTWVWAAGCQIRHQKQWTSLLPELPAALCADVQSSGQHFIPQTQTAAPQDTSEFTGITACCHSK